jgi:hypothetical protein
LHAKQIVWKRINWNFFVGLLWYFSVHGVVVDKSNMRMRKENEGIFSRKLNLNYVRFDPFTAGHGPNINILLPSFYLGRKCSSESTRILFHFILGKDPLLRSSVLFVASKSSRCKSVNPRLSIFQHGLPV